MSIEEFNWIIYILKGPITFLQNEIVSIKNGNALQLILKSNQEILELSRQQGGQIELKMSVNYILAIYFMYIQTLLFKKTISFKK